MNIHYIGADCDSHNLIESAVNLKKAGGNLMQIFITLPGNRKIEEKSKNELSQFNNFLINNSMKVVIHSSYTHNLARNWDTYSWWIKNLEIEIKYAHSVGAIGIVLHFGKKLDLSTEEAYNNMYTSLLYIHHKTLDYKNVLIFLETTAGQGSEICYKMEDLSHFYRKLSKNENKSIRDRFKLCMDTCHIFAAGYDITTIKKIKTYMEEFEELIGIRYIGLLHLNDSKTKIGSLKDRHDNIGKGYIGLIPLQYFYNFFKKINVPIILETPANGYIREIKLLKNSKI